jgi:acetyl-CoA acetyltransferase family protein
MKRTFVVHAKRTAIGKIGGKLASVRVDDLLAHVLTDIKNNILFDPLLIDDVIVGCANQAGEDNRNIARMAVILSGLPFEIPGTTINRLCGSSLDAVIDGWARIQSGVADCLIIAGAESMTRAPYVLGKTSEAFGRDQKMFDTTLGWRFSNSKMEKIFPLLSMGETAEEVANQFNISRLEQDAFAANSHKKAIMAWDRGDFTNEVLPYLVELKKESYVFSKDECPRSDSTIETLGKLKPVFRKDGTVTAGNSSPMNDGASGLLIVSEEFMKKHNLTPMVEITGAATRGVHPNTMGIGPVAAVQTLLKKYNKKITDFDCIELNEAFAAQALGCIKGLDLDPDKVNINGGAIALGHALGSSGTRIVTTLAHQMQKNKNLKEGLATMCIGVGQGIAVSFKNC